MRHLNNVNQYKVGDNLVRKILVIKYRSMKAVSIYLLAGACADKRNDCASFRHRCNEIESYMREHCKATCNFC